MINFWKFTLPKRKEQSETEKNFDKIRALLSGAQSYELGLTYLDSATSPLPKEELEVIQEMGRQRYKILSHILELGWYWWKLFSMEEMRLNGNKPTNMPLSALTNLPPLSDFGRLRTLHLNDFPNLRYLPALPDTLENLYCERNFLYQLPIRLPKHLKRLYCQSNVLVELPPLPEGLSALVCHTNKLRELPKLPSGLYSLHCSGNRICELPKELPVSLRELSCYYNEMNIYEQHRIKAALPTCHIDTSGWNR